MFLCIHDKWVLIHESFFTTFEWFVTFYDQLKMRLGQPRALQANGLLHAHSQLKLSRLYEAGAVSL